jgi:rhodanese-related sulfurtransferase
MFYIKNIDHARWVSALLLVITMPGAMSVAAGEYLSPDAIEGATTIDAEQLIALVVKHRDTVLVDSRVGTDRADGYIEGSVYLVDSKTDCDSLARLIGTRTTPVIFYCNGVHCDRSGRAVGIAVACGYRNVYWFRGGIEEWREKDYPLILDDSGDDG